MVDVARARKLAVRIREVVASTLELQVKDPRLGMVTITDAKLTPDLREATLYYTVYGDDHARAEDARVQALASSAAPAGDADPYKVPRVVEDDEDEDGE